MSKRLANGCRTKEAHAPQIVVRFDADQFAEIRAEAERAGVSFAEQVRTFCEWGLADLRDDRAEARP